MCFAQHKNIYKNSLKYKKPGAAPAILIYLIGKRIPPGISNFLYPAGTSKRLSG